MTYQVHLLDGLGVAPSPFGLSSQHVLNSTLRAINATLEGYFQLIVNAHDELPKRRKTYETASVRWLAGFPAIAPDEILIYLMPAGMSIASSGSVAMRRSRAAHEGLTNATLGGTASEVYLHSADPVLLANTMFHEAMHNKLALGDGLLHAGDGLACSTTTSPISATTPLSEANIRDMAAALELNRPQWTAGIVKIFVESSRPHHDPGKGLF